VPETDIAPVTAIAPPLSVITELPTAFADVNFAIVPIVPLMVDADATATHPVSVAAPDSLT